MVSYFSRRSPTRIPEHCLYGLIPLLPFMMVALAICGIAIQRQLHWIALLVGGGLFFFCLSAATGLLQTYVSESYIVSPMDAQAVFVFFKSIWGFAIAFFVMVSLYLKLRVADLNTDIISNQPLRTGVGGGEGLHKRVFDPRCPVHGPRSIVMCWCALERPISSQVAGNAHGMTMANLLLLHCGVASLDVDHKCFRQVVAKYQHISTRCRNASRVAV